MKSALICLSLLLTLSLHAQEPLTNETISKLAKAGVGEDIILGMVNQQPGTYSLSADEIVAMKKAGVSDKVLAALILKSAGTNAQTIPSTAARLKSPSETSSAPAASTDPASGPSSNDGHTRVFVTDSQSWEMRGGWNAAGNNGTLSAGGYQSGGARPQTAEIIKTFNQRCPQVTVTNNLQKADFAVTLDHEGGKSIIHHENKIVVYNRDGDDVFSDSTRELATSVRNACEAIMSHRPWTGPHSAAALSAALNTAMANQAIFDVNFTSTPANASVTISGQPIGQTPFIARLPPGTYKVAFSIDGYSTVTKYIAIGTGYPTTVSTTLPTQLKPAAARP